MPCARLGRMPLDDLPEPPPPPETRRRIRLYVYQWIGLLLLLLLPVLASAGVFGESWRVERASVGALSVVVSYPSRFRYKQLNQIEVQVRNTSGTALDSVKVSLDTSFATRFSTVASVPPLERAFELSIAAIPPSASRLAIIEIQAERYGRHSGTLTIASAPDTVRVPLAVLIFP